MMNAFPISTHVQYAQELQQIIRETGAYDKKLKWLFLNTLWYEPHQRERYSNVLKEYIAGITTWTERHVILVIDSAASTFALVPIMGEVADLARCRLSIWREVLPIGLSQSWLLPSRLETGLICVLVQDVVSKGSVLRRVAQDIKMVGWQVELIAAIAKDDSNASHFDQSLVEFRLDRELFNRFSISAFAKFIRNS